MRTNNGRLFGFLCDKGAGHAHKFSVPMPKNRGSVASEHAPHLRFRCRDGSYRAILGTLKKLYTAPSIESRTRRASK